MTRTPVQKNFLGEVDPKKASRLIQASSDIALVLDGEGTILDVMVSDAELSGQGPREWIGRPWVQTVTAESRQKVEALLRDAEAAVAAARWRQVNHPTKGGADLPVLYATLRLADDGRSPAKGRIIAFGRDLRSTVALQQRLVEAQQAMERDYWRFRESETRYRHLFQTSSEAVLVVDGITLKVIEANPAARALCSPVKNRLVGSPLPTLFDASSAEDLQAMVAAARSIGKNDAVRVTLGDGATQVLVSASMFRHEESTFLLVRLAPTPSEVQRRGKGARGAARGIEPLPQAGALSNAEALLRSYMVSSPDGLVFTDVHGRVIMANRAFVSLAQLSAEDQARGEALDRWVGRTGVELSVLITNLRQRGSVGLFVTSLRGEYGATVEVEISASVLSHGGETILAFAIRDIERRLKPDVTLAGELPRSVGQLTELVGRVPLKEIVAETTDLIEQLCIETALQMTGDNRASASLLLGLSRQSLYVKLRRFGIGEIEPVEDE